MVDPKTLISELTVEEFLSLQPKLHKKYEYGLKGIAKIFGCSISKAKDIKKSGHIDGAIYQNRNIIVVDVDKALVLFHKNAKK